MISITFGNAQQEFFVSRFRAFARKRNARIARLRTKADAERYLSSVRKKIASSLHLPREKCPLDPRITGTVDFPECTLEKVLLQSRPGVTLTCNFLLPRNRKGKVPAVLMLSGHAPDGKASAMYQCGSRGLAARGFAVLTVDPIGQGERNLYAGIEQTPRAPTEQHTLAAKQLIPVGEDLFSWRIWDAMRALDYLESRPEVDPARIGAHGESGGGTLTIWLTACDPRVAWAAPASAVTTWLHNVENEMPVDYEQIPFSAAAKGLDCGDFLAAAAPRPLRLLGQTQDFFDPRGFTEIHDQLKHIYTLLGCPEKVDYAMDTHTHGLFQPLRESAYDFFCRCAGLPNPRKEEAPVELVPESRLWAAPGGSVYNLPGEKRIWEISAEKAAKLKRKRRALSREEMALRLKRLLGIRPLGTPYCRRLLYRFFTDSGSFQNYSRFGLETEPGRVMCMLHRSAKKALFYDFMPVAGKTVLYVADQDSASELKLREPEPGDALYSLDCRGIGECMPTSCEQMPERDFYYYYGFDYHYASLHLLWGESICGRRTEEVLAALELTGEKSSSGRVSLEARGFGCIPALFAAVISDRVSEVRLEGCPGSWERIASEMLLSHAVSPASALPGGILALTDIPELIALLRDSGIPVTLAPLPPAEA